MHKCNRIVFLNTKMSLERLYWCTKGFQYLKMHFICVLLYYLTVKRRLKPILQIRESNGKVLFCYFSTYLIRENHNFYAKKVCLTWHMWHSKNAFSAKCNCGCIAIHIKNYLDYQYTNIQPYKSQTFCVFARYATLVP